MVKPKVMMVDKEFGRLKVIRQAEPLKQNTREAWYLCKCQCGGEKIIRGTSLRKGITTSCGCVKSEVTTQRNRDAAEKNYDLKGKRFHWLVVLEESNSRRAGSRVWKCRCDCGNFHYVTTHNLLSGNVKSCGRFPMRQPDDLVGKRFGLLTVLELTDARKSNGSAVWKCRCECGNELNVAGGNMKRGTTISCGCVRRINLQGKRFGNLTVLRLGDKSNKGNGSYWICQCDCGNICEVYGSKLLGGQTHCMQCSHDKFINDLTGNKYGKLLVLCDSGIRRPKSNGVLWTCQCECGQIKNIRQDALVSGVTVSCGCTKSRGNEKVAKILRQANIDFVPEYSPNDMKGRKRFDFAILQEKKVKYFIEYDGVLHMEFTNSGWDTEERFRRTHMSDEEKNDYCREKGIPLIRIPYTRFEELQLEDLLLDTTQYLI